MTSVQIIRLHIRRILALMYKEFITIWKDPKSRGLVLGMPIIQLLLFANSVTMEVKNIDMAVLDYSRTPESRELLSSFAGSTRFRNLYYVENLDALRDKIETQKVQLGLIVPDDFAIKIKQKTATDVQLIADGRQTSSASMASGYAMQIIGTYSNKVAPISTTAINVVSRNWFNQNLDYQLYILQMLVPMLALSCTLMLTSMSVCREKENGTFEQLIISPLLPVEIMIGKLLPPLLIAMTVTMFMTGVVVFVYGVPMVGSLMQLLIMMFTALLAISGVGLFISSVTKTQQQAILGVMTFQVPAFMLSGFVSPVQDMPDLAQFITRINPVWYFMDGTQMVFFRGLNYSMMWKFVLPLLAISFVTLGIATWTFTRKLE
ncbi:MAG: ABC transporter permease [Phascolarctobacterium sp.]|nr:ABC transporter permease [Phascolarctobacterium sp.]